MLPANLSFVDIETTGASPQKGRIIEIGILRVENNKLVKTYNTLINPQSYIDPFITQLTGIYPQAVENAPTFEQVKDEILEILKDSVFVAHNVRFDYGFLRNEFRRFGHHFSTKHFCTVKLARLLYPGSARYNLDSIIERFGFSCENRHRAFDDAKVLFDFYTKAKEDLPAQLFENAVDTVLKRPSVPLGISQESLDALPESPGVYLFYGSEGMPLYIGKSINIRDRVLSHFSSDHLSSTEMKISQQITRIETIPTAGELGALFLESTLIKKHQPLFNRKLRLSKKLIALKKVTTDTGYQTVEKVLLADVPSHELPLVVGIFTSQKRIKEVLSDICAKYRLCPKLFGLEKGKGMCFAYQLEKCSGGCIGNIHVLQYNLKFDEAFYIHKIKQWPFSGPIVIKEKTDKEEHFIVDKWCLVGTLKDESDVLNLETPEYLFDYDTYKILQQYVYRKQHLGNIHSYKFTSQALS